MIEPPTLERWQEGLDDPHEALELFIFYGRTLDALCREDWEAYGELMYPHGASELQYMDGLLPGDDANLERILSSRIDVLKAIIDRPENVELWRSDGAMY
jgi:hypothetical protein